MCLVKTFALLDHATMTWIVIASEFLSLKCSHTIYCVSQTCILSVIRVLIFIFESIDVQLLLSNLHFFKNKNGR